MNLFVVACYPLYKHSLQYFVYFYSFHSIAFCVTFRLECGLDAGVATSGAPPALLPATAQNASAASKAASAAGASDGAMASSIFPRNLLVYYELLPT